MSAINLFKEREAVRELVLKMTWNCPNDWKGYPIEFRHIVLRSCVRAYRSIHLQRYVGHGVEPENIGIIGRTKLYVDTTRLGSAIASIEP